MGFGFVTFQSKEMATSAMNAGVVLDGRKLEIKFARQGTTKLNHIHHEINVWTKENCSSRIWDSVLVKRDLRELFGYAILLW